jgi:hypothetical protein
MDAQALQALEIKLRRQQSTMESQPRAEVPIDWASPQGIRVHSTAVQAAEAVDMLQRQSRQSGGMTDPDVASGRSLRPAARRRSNPAAHRRRMATMAQRINDLSLAQQQVMADIQRVQQSFIDQTPAGLGVGVEALNLDQAMTAWASLDATGQVVLSHRPVDPLPHPEAHALAHHLRQTYGVPQHQWSEVGQLGPVVRRWWAWAAEAIPSQPRRLEILPGSTLSTTEALLWAGAGVAGRLVTQSLLATIPSLGVVAVMAGLASLTLALYRALVRPNPDVHLMLRVGLALAGLVIGGSLI